MFKFCNHKCETVNDELLKKAWIEGFSLGVSKQWDLVLPIMTENMAKLTSKIKEDATREAIKRFQGNKNA